MMYNGSQTDRQIAYIAQLYSPGPSPSLPPSPGLCFPTCLSVCVCVVMVYERLRCSPLIGNCRHNGIIALYTDSSACHSCSIGPQHHNRFLSLSTCYFVELGDTAPQF